LAAPIVHEKTNNRSVYFPKHIWYDLHSGKQYEKGNHNLTNITLTAKVPLFLAEASVMFMQDTTSVTKTRQLTNIFELIGGLHLDSTNSSSTISSGSGSMMSIQNYNDESKLSSCLSQGCQYLFNLSFVQTSTTSQLEISVVYTGGSGLNEEFAINKVKLYLNGNVYQKTLAETLVFKGTDKKIVNMLSNDEL
jgi:hypothetical protein